jgi:molybdate/tungstate transport system substrate-binding protein
MKRFKMKPIWSLIIMGLLVLVIACNSDKEGSKESKPETKTVKETITKSNIHILHAGSLSMPFKDVAEAFMNQFPQYKVLLEGHGSRTCARQITDLKREVDIMASADSAVIRNLLMPDYTDYCIDFTTNEMAIMFTEKSQFADIINGDNWYEILLKPEVQYGHSDPNADPCGYRSLLTWQLAEKHYKVENLNQKLTEAMPQKNIRSKETDLIALLEAGELDYIFIYRSVAEQHHSKYVLLPNEINLKSAELVEFYKTASVKITGKKPGEWIEKKGAPMVYGITIPNNAPNKEAALKFMSFLLGPSGQEIMKKNGQPQILPPRIDNKEKLPQELLTFFK